jgi:hypothetical protein
MLFIWALFFPLCWCPRFPPPPPTHTHKHKYTTSLGPGWRKRCRCGAGRRDVVCSGGRDPPAHIPRPQPHQLWRPIRASGRRARAGCRRRYAAVVGTLLRPLWGHVPGQVWGWGGVAWGGEEEERGGVGWGGVGWGGVGWGGVGWGGGGGGGQGKVALMTNSREGHVCGVRGVDKKGQVRTAVLEDVPCCLPQTPTWTFCCPT